MTQDEFVLRMNRADAMMPGNPDYWQGYRRGLRRLYHGQRFGTTEEHEKMIALADDPVDVSKQQFGRGYRDGFRGE